MEAQFSARPGQQPPGPPPRGGPGGPRGSRWLAWLGWQAIFLLAVAAAGGLLYANLLRGLAAVGLELRFDFWRQEAGFAIAEGIPFLPSDSYGRAFWVGVVNTLRVAGLGIGLATVLGVVVGVARLSANWLVRSLAGLYIELFRNTPLLLQLLFWYGAVVLQLPPVRQSLGLPGGIYLNQRGLYLPRPLAGPGWRAWLAAAGAGLLAGLALYGWRRWRLERAGAIGWPVAWAASLALAAAVGGWWAAPGPPIIWERPELGLFNFSGGWHLSPEFTALLLGLVVYTAAFIAEVVRGAVQAVPRGQWEAARAVGLRPAQVLTLVVLPQALRILVPPLTSQYLNLVKNSSLAIAIGFPDLFNVGMTILNQTGQSIPVFALIMVTYLAMSLLTALLMNWYNRRVWR